MVSNTSLKWCAEDYGLQVSDTIISDHMEELMPGTFCTNEMEEVSMEDISSLDQVHEPCLLNAGLFGVQQTGYSLPIADCITNQRMATSCEQFCLFLSGTMSEVQDKQEEDDCRDWGREAAHQQLPVLSSHLVPKEHATMLQSISEDAGESSRKHKQIEAGGDTADEEATRKRSNKGQPWTIEEHELFLRGLQKYGRGKWRMICLEFLKTKTPTQVASHAQKYFERLKVPSSKHRTSIHDIRLVDNGVVFSPENATSGNCGLSTSSKYAITEGNYGQFANSNNAISNSNSWLFAGNNNATPNWHLRSNNNPNPTPNSYGHLANGYNATPNWQFTNSNNTFADSNHGHFESLNSAPPSWQFASYNYSAPNSSYGQFANNLAPGNICGPNQPTNVGTEHIMHFAGQQQNFAPSFQHPSMFKF